MADSHIIYSWLSRLLHFSSQSLQKNYSFYISEVCVTDVETVCKFVNFMKNIKDSVGVLVHRLLVYIVVNISVSFVLNFSGSS